MTKSKDIKRVLFLGIPLNGQNGVAKAQLDLTKALQEKGIKVDNISAWPFHKTHTLTTDENIAKVFSSIEEFLDFTKKEGTNYDIIHAHSHAWAPTLTPKQEEVSKLKRELQRGLVYTFHSYKPSEYEAQRELLGYTDRMISLTPEGEATLYEVFHDIPNLSGNTRVIPLIINPEIVSDEEAKEIRESKFLSDKTILLYVGRISPEKGTRELGPAFREIHRINQNVRLIVAGTESDRGERRILEESLEEAINATIFTGWVSEREVALYQRMSDLQIVPSKFEAYGLAGAYAVMQGIPIAVNPIPTLRRIYKLDTETPYGIPISPEGTQEGIVKAFLEYMKDPSKAKEMIKKGKKEFLEECSPSRIVEKTLKVYRELI
ncbi:glycosyltransferase family 4 protein [Candidatus Woesearchaeota archaeon]|nr:glycosyltransferase family 4 protein [Candidatus Woesearchaeota archaeon]